MCSDSRNISHWNKGALKPASITLCYLFLVGLLFCCFEIQAQEPDTVLINGTKYPFTDADFELLNAAFEGDTLKINAFLSLGTDVNTTSLDGTTPLMYAAQEGHLKATEILLHAGADVNRKPLNQTDALLAATIAGHVFIADTLILNGANVNTRNIDGVTPLMYAAFFNDVLMADMLLFYGADVNATDNFGNRAIHLSAYYNSIEVSVLLLENEAEPDPKDLYGFTPLIIAARNGYTDHVILLVENGADVNAVNNGNATALSQAIAGRHYPIVEYLVASGADWRHQISEKVGMTDLAFIHGDHPTRELFKRMGATRSRRLRTDHFLITGKLSFNNKDIMVGGEAGFHETKSRLNYSLGYMTRPAVRSVNYEMAPDTIYQYWESRSYFHIGADKHFHLNRDGTRHQWGAFAGLNLAYTYGNFRGSNNKPDEKIQPLARAGILYLNRLLHLKLNYEYLRFKPSKASPHRLSISAGIAFGLKRYQVAAKSEPRL